MINEFQMENILDSRMKNTFIALIPKKEQQ